MSDQLTFLSAAPPAKPSASRESVWDWTIRAAISPLNTWRWLDAFAPAGWSGRTSPASCQSTVDERWAPSSGCWANSGIGGPTECLTLNMCEWTGSAGLSPSAADVCSLSDILERGRIPERYYLTPKACAGLIRRAVNRGKRLPQLLARAPRGGGGLGTDFDLDGGLVAFGGNNTAGPIAVSTALKAHDSPSGRLDFESDTFIAQAVAPCVDASYGRLQGCSGQDLRHGHGHLIAYPGAVVGPLKAPVDIGWSLGAEEADKLIPIAFDTTQLTNPHNRSDPQPGGPCHPLTAAGHPPAVAFDLRGRDGGSQFEGPHDTANIRAASGGSSRSYVAERWRVRRLTPRECERLQGFPDDFTLIAWRGRPAVDGRRYKAVGNSMAVNAMRWIGRRIELVERAAEGRP